MIQPPAVATHGGHIGVVCGRKSDRVVAAICTCGWRGMDRDEPERGQYARMDLDRHRLGDWPDD